MFCFVLGGNLKSESTALHLVSLNAHYSVEIAGSSRLIWKDFDVVGMELVYDSPWPELGT
jgi:hypothetical protein